MNSEVSRRGFLRISSAATGSASLAGAFGGLMGRVARGENARSVPAYGALRAIRDEATGLELLKLPEGFRYRSFCWTGDTMENGKKCPAAHDGMAVIDADDEGVITLCRNHELGSDRAAFAGDPIVYDASAAGGTSHLKFNTKSGEWLSAAPSLAGTVKNCAGGPTPWGSWLSCEETVVDPGQMNDGRPLKFKNDHGWIFEVPANGHASAEPLKDMGKFVHEAVAVDPETGYVYETEDRSTAGLYRFLPKTTGKLSDGGTLQMLKVPGSADLRKNVTPHHSYPCEWVTIPDPHLGHTPGTTDALGVFKQGKKLGGTTFARLEGCWYGNGQIYFDSTSGGNTGNGQIWVYDPKADTVTMIFESPSSEVLDAPDNLAVSPRGGIILCEDGSYVPQRLHGLTPDGKLFDFAANNVVLKGERNGFAGDFRGSEWAGASFSPDGKWLFVNLQNPGITFAITGPWEDGGL